MDESAGNLIRSMMQKAMQDSGRINVRIQLSQPVQVDSFYRKKGFTTHWSERDSLLAIADTIVNFIYSARYHGLFPENYHLFHLFSVREKLRGDSSGKEARLDAALWAENDLLLTDAFIQLIQDIKLGRLPQDSVSSRKDSVLLNDFFLDQFIKFRYGASFSSIVASLEPVHKGYHELKSGIASFLQKADLEKTYTFVPFPATDSFAFKSSLFKRLQEEGLIPDSLTYTDTSKALIVAAIKEYQKKSGFTVDGVVGTQTAKRLNTSDKDRFFQLAITLDRYKLLPEQMPEKYVWVNIPAYNLKLVEHDSVILESKIVVGKPKTRTPVLNSAISEMITFPQWTIPASIIEKEILPAVKRNPEYLIKKGYSLIDKEGMEVDPFTVEWVKYKKTIPYKVVQGSGDDNALGILKFNFSNKYAVYLHDTNQRYFFSRVERALSHGCVRVQDWKTLAFYILKNDSLNAGSRNYTPSDSVKRWLSVKEKHIVPVRNRIPLFIRYFTCEGKNGTIIFYDDIYNEDAELRKYYSAIK